MLSSVCSMVGNWNVVIVDIKCCSMVGKLIVGLVISVGLVRLSIDIKLNYVGIKVRFVCLFVKMMLW